MRKITNRKAVSPVIATVILVAVAITVSVAVSYWMSGISSQYTQFEKVEIQSGYSVKDTTGDTGWDIVLELKNSGSATSAITTVFINEVPIDTNNYNGNDVVADEVHTSIPNTSTGVTLVSGNSTTVHVYISDTYGSLSSGTTVDLKLHSANGNDYIKLIKLV